MATATRTAPKRRIGPADHGRRMTLDEFIEADFQEGWLYELARGVVEVTEVPGPWHGRIVDRVAEMFILYDEQHPGGIKYRAGGGECRMRLPGMVSDRHPDQAIYLDPEPPGPRCLDAMGASHRRRGRQPPRQETRLRHQARGIPADGRPRILDPRPQEAPDACPRPSGRRLGRDDRARIRRLSDDLLPGLEVRPGRVARTRPR